MRALIATTFLVSVLLSAQTPALAKDALIVKESKHPVTMTLNRLEKILLSKGIKIMGRVNHAAGAKAAGMTLPETEVIIFGNPKLGTPLIQASPQIAIDLPMKILVWKDANGKVFLGYSDPDDLKEKYEVEGKDEIFATMSKALDAFTTAAAAEK